jgi:hypothetical protein
MLRILMVILPTSNGPKCLVKNSSFPHTLMFIVDYFPVYLNLVYDNFTSLMYLFGFGPIFNVLANTAS